MPVILWDERSTKTCTKESRKMKIKLTPYDMEIVHRALVMFRNSEQVAMTSSEDTLKHLESMAKHFAACDTVELTTNQTTT